MRGVDNNLSGSELFNSIQRAIGSDKRVRFGILDPRLATEAELDRQHDEEIAKLDKSLALLQTIIEEGEAE